MYAAVFFFFSARRRASTSACFSLARAGAFWRNFVESFLAAGSHLRKDATVRRSVSCFCKFERSETLRRRRRVPWQDGASNVPREVLDLAVDDVVMSSLERVVVDLYRRRRGAPRAGVGERGFKSLVEEIGLSEREEVVQLRMEDVEPCSPFQDG